MRRKQVVPLAERGGTGGGVRGDSTLRKAYLWPPGWEALGQAWLLEEDSAICRLVLEGPA